MTGWFKHFSYAWQYFKCGFFKGEPKILTVALVKHLNWNSYLKIFFESNDLDKCAAECEA